MRVEFIKPLQSKYEIYMGQPKRTLVFRLALCTKVAVVSFAVYLIPRATTSASMCAKAI